MTGDTAVRFGHRFRVDPQLWRNLQRQFEHAKGLVREGHCVYGIMYTKRIKLKGFGPIDNLDIKLPVEGGTPKPVVLVGQNGSGKSIVLSHVVSGLLKAKDMVYHQTPEVEPGRAYRLKTNFYIKTGEQFSFSRVDFENSWYVSELTTMRKKQDYPEVPPGIAGTDLELMWRQMDSVSNDCVDSNLGTDYEDYIRLSSVVAGNCILYFPFNRFEDPAWLNRGNLTAQAEFIDRKPMLAHTERRAIATSPLELNRNWLVDVLYDRRVSETRSVRVPLPSPGEDKPWFLEAERAETRDHDESVLRTALRIVRTILLDESNATFRLGRRGLRFVALHGDDGLIVPNIFQLSSGETSLLNIFLSILRDFEWGGSRFSDAVDVRGVVVVDEVDLHLHALHQFEVLPLLIRMFPRVQFILTTHSPLLVLGMKQAFGDDGFALHRVPDGHRINPEEFSEFGDAYSAFSSTRRFVDDLEEAVRTATSSVLLTEGDTDCRYLECAAELLGREAVLRRFVVRAGGGSGNLAKIWRHPMPDLFAQKVVLLFDCDENRPHGDRGQILQRSVPFCPDNPIRSGIENLFSRQTLEKARRHSSAFIDVEDEHQRTHRGVQDVIPEEWTVNSDEKTNLCEWLCENGTADDFVHFQGVFDLLKEVIDAVQQS